AVIGVALSRNRNRHTLVARSPWPMTASVHIIGSPLDIGCTPKAMPCPKPSRYIRASFLPVRSSLVIVRLPCLGSLPLVTCKVYRCPLTLSKAKHCNTVPSCSGFFQNSRLEGAVRSNLPDVGTADSAWAEADRPRVAPSPARTVAPPPAASRPRRLSFRGGFGAELMRDSFAGAGTVRPRYTKTDFRHRTCCPITVMSSTMRPLVDSHPLG